jgi:hypothetical protein
MGKKFPITQRRIAFPNLTLSKEAASSPPRNSSIGIREIKNTISSLLTIPDMCMVNHVTKLLIASFLEELQTVLLCQLSKLL